MRLTFTNNLSIGNNTNQNAIKTEETRAHILYFNDVHGNSMGAKKLKTVSDRFDKQKQPEIDQLKMVGGDIFIGQDPKNNRFLSKFLNLISPDAVVIGNHDLDMGTKRLSEFMKEQNFKFFASNIKMEKFSSLMDATKEGKLAKSAIIEKNGHKYGVIGVIPPDVIKRLDSSSQALCQDISVLNFDDTIKDIQNEINKLEQQGVNKIILVSHAGYKTDKEIVKKTKGLDIVVGGHTHTLVEGIKPGDNYIYSASNDPVLIVQAKKNGDYYGIIDVIFDENGKIKQIANDVHNTKDVPNNALIKHYEDEILGLPQKIGVLDGRVEMMTNNKVEENPMSSLVADAVRKKSKAQIVFNNMEAVKATHPGGVLTDKELREILPFINKVSMYKLSEKEIIDTLSAGAQKNRHDGCLQVSGIRYKISGPNNKATDVYLINDDGTETRLNTENPDPEKYYDVAYNSFLSSGTDKLEMLKAPKRVVDIFEWTDYDAVLEYVKSFNGQPIVLKKTGRITTDEV